MKHLVPSRISWLLSMWISNWSHPMSIIAMLQNVPFALSKTISLPAFAVPANNFQFTCGIASSLRPSWPWISFTAPASTPNYLPGPNRLAPLTSIVPPLPMVHASSYTKNQCALQLGAPWCEWLVPWPGPELLQMLHHLGHKLNTSLTPLPGCPTRSLCQWPHPLTTSRLALLTLLMPSNSHHLIPPCAIMWQPSQGLATVNDHPPWHGIPQPTITGS